MCYWLYTSLKPGSQYDATPTQTQCKNRNNLYSCVRGRRFGQPPLTVVPFASYCEPGLSVIGTLIDSLFSPAGSPLVRDKHKITIPSPLSIETSPGPLSQYEEASKNETSLVGDSPNKELFSSSDNFANKVVGVRFVDKDVCAVNNEDTPPKEKEKGRWKFLKSGSQKSSKKLTVKEFTRNQDAELEGGKNGRPRSGRKHRYEEVQFKYMNSKEYEQEAGNPPTSPTGFNRSASLQVGIDEVGGSEQPTSSRYTHERSTSVQMNIPPKYIQNHISPIKPALTPVEEVPGDLTGSPSHPRIGPMSSQPGPPSGESDNEQEEIVRTLSVSHPVLRIQEESSWDKTVDRRILKKLNKAERERQAILHELIQTETNHFRALHVLKLVFREQISKVVGEEITAQLFPELDNLIEISNSFLKGLKSKKNESDDIIDDLSDILLDQFTGENKKQMVHSFGMFCSVHLNATEIFKENMKKKSFSRLMKQLHAVKECQRLTLPDYYLGISQRLAKVLTLLKRLAKKSESLRLDHAPRVHKSLAELEGLITDVDKMVDDNKMKMEVEAIQSRLELPRLSKFKDRQERLKFSLTAQDRRLRKRGMAEWIGHGKHICECVCGGMRV